MSYAPITATGTGSPQIVNIPWPYISKDHVFVLVGGTLLSEGVGYVWINDGAIQLTAAPAAEILVARSTSPSTRLVDYQNGVPLTEGDLDTDSLQAFYLLEELDGRLDLLAATGGGGGGLPVLPGITVLDEGSPLGTAATVREVDFAGAGVTATRSGDRVTVSVTATGGGGVPEAPTDGKLYGRKNATWDEAASVSYVETLVKVAPWIRDFSSPATTFGITMLGNTSTTPFPTVAPSMSVVSNSLTVASPPGLDTRARFDLGPIVADFDLTAFMRVPFDATPVPFGTFAGAGIAYRTTNWGNGIWRGGYQVKLEAGGLVRLIRGDNSGSNSNGSGISVAVSAAGAWPNTSAEVQLDLVIRGTRHIVKVNGTTVIDVVDGSFTGAGLLAFVSYESYLRGTASLRRIEATAVGLGNLSGSYLPIAGGGTVNGRIGIVPNISSSPTVPGGASWLQLSGNGSMYDAAISVAENGHPSTKRAAIQIGKWGLVQDPLALNQKDFGFWDGESAPQYWPLRLPEAKGGGILIDQNPLLLAPSVAAYPSLRIPHGVAPSAPTNGDVWTTTAGMYARINGVTVGPLGAGGGGGGSVAIEDEGVQITNAASTINFVGDGVVAAVSGTKVNVAIPTARTGLIGLTNLNLLFEGANGATAHTDSSQFNLTVTTFASAALTNTLSKFGSTSLSLNGTSQYLTVAGSAILPNFSDDFTIEGWFYQNSGATSGTRILVDTRLTVGSANGFAIAMQAGALNVYSNNAYQFGAGIALAANTWHHFALVRTGSVVRLYANGVPSGTTWLTNANFSDTSFFIGRDALSAISFFGGNIDCIRMVRNRGVYVTQFSPPTVAPTNNLPFPLFIASPYAEAVRQDAPLVLWPMDEASGTSATDLSGNGKTGTYTGSPTLGQASQVQTGGTSVQFDGVDDRVEITSLTELDSYAGWVLMEAMVTIGAGNANGILFGVSVNGRLFGMGMGTTTGDTAGRNLLVYQEGNAWATVASSIAAGTYHLAFAVNTATGNVRAFVNGQLTSGLLSITTAANAARGASVGCTPGGSRFISGTPRMSNASITMLPYLNNTSTEALPILSSIVREHYRASRR